MKIPKECQIVFSSFYQLNSIIVKTNERENEKNLHLSFENNRGLFVVLSEKIAAEVAVELLGT